MLCRVWLINSAPQYARSSGSEKVNSAGASLSGTLWNTKRTPSSSSSCCGRSISSVGARMPIFPKPTALPRPLSTNPVASRASALPYIMPARLAMAMPIRMFSLVASSMKPAGATTGTWRARASSALSTPSAPPKWSAWLWVKTTADTFCSPRCLRAKAIEAAAVSREVAVSTTIQPVLPCIRLMLARSKPRNCQMPSATLNSPVRLFSSAWRHRLGLTVVGASPLTKAKAS